MSTVNLKYYEKRGRAAELRAFRDFFRMDRDLFSSARRLATHTSYSRGTKYKNKIRVFFLNESSKNRLNSFTRYF